MRIAKPVLAWSVLLCAPVLAAAPPTTFCNPLNLDYRFNLKGPGVREAADPVVVLYRDDYYLFASKSGGYWYSKDLREWRLVEPTGLPIEAYAPAVMVLGEKMFYTANNVGIFVTEDPKRGVWREYANAGAFGDPAFLADDDGKVFLYYGLAKNGVISGLELDARTMLPRLKDLFVCFPANPREHGWERSGEENLGVMLKGKRDDEPWLEGAWMTKHAGRYYLQYAAPGTQFKTYADGVYVSSSPRGPFVYAPHSPVCHKPGGFVAGAGHGSTFRDKQGNYWRIVTMTISVKRMFERRLGLFPAGFDAGGLLHTDTVLGDYPQYLPGVKKDPIRGNRTGWMLLSYGKTARASSTLEGFPPEKAFDEEIRSWWSAKSGAPGEWLMVDLGKRCRVHAVQVNFAEQDMTANGRSPEYYEQYVLEASGDAKTWAALADKSANRTDVPHDYIELERPAMARYIRIRNVHTPGGGKFALRGLRVFGSGLGRPPAAVNGVRLARDAADDRNATVRWEAAAGADGYIVRYGIAPGKLYNNYQVQGATSVSINSLNRGVSYYFRVDSFNDSGVTAGRKPLSAPASGAPSGAAPAPRGRR